MMVGCRSSGTRCGQRTDGGASWSVVTYNTGSPATTYTVFGLASGSWVPVRGPGPQRAGSRRLHGHRRRRSHRRSRLRRVRRRVCRVWRVRVPRQVSVSWTAPAIRWRADHVGIEVEKSLVGRGSDVWTAAGSVTGTGTSLVVSGLAKGESYVFQVRAVNCRWSGSVVGCVGSGGGAGDVPGAGDGSGRGRRGESVVLTWTAPVDDGGSPIVGYAVQFSGPMVVRRGRWSRATPGRRPPAYTVAGLASGQLGTGSRSRPAPQRDPAPTPTTGTITTPVAPMA